MALLKGQLSPRALALVMERAWLHREELLEAWEEREQGRRPRKIDPLRREAAMELCATVTDVRPAGGFRLELVFSDGQSGVVDLAERIFGRGGDFRALEDPAFFRRVRVDPELGTIVWPNDVDFCPELLRQWVAAGCVPPYERQGATPVVN